MSQSWRGRGGHGGSKGGGGSTRITQPTCANPIFVQWLTEWREDAVQKNSKTQYVYSKAIASLQKYPLLMKSGRACLVLEFFGPGIAKMIDKRMLLENIGQGNGDNDSQDDALSQVLGSNPEDDPYKKPAKKRPKKSNAKDSSQDGEQDDGIVTQPPKKANRGAKAYIPAFRSGSYALLVALALKELKPGYRGFVTKSELSLDAQAHCDSSMTRAENPSSTYTTWNSMSTLLTKQLILKRGSPTQYMLTPEGRTLATKLLQAENGGAALVTQTNSQSDDGDSDSQTESRAAPAHYRTILEPGRFEVVLYVDTSETTAKCKKEEVIGELRKNGVALEVVRLSVGDFVWVCREIASANPSRNRLTISRSAELVLPYIVERKRSDDLASSIKDGRFHEQKFRLVQTGMQPIYLIEHYGSGDFGLAHGALSQAVANTQMTNSFLIQETSSIKDTCGYLTHMTRHLSKMYQGKRISSCNKQEWATLKDEQSSSGIYLMIFSDLNDFGGKIKNWTITEMWARHLMRLRGLSVERAFAIVQKYPTFQSLRRAYRNCDSDKEREGLLASIYFGNSAKTIGPSISRQIYRLYNLPQLPL